MSFSFSVLNENIDDLFEKKYSIENYELKMKWYDVRFEMWVQSNNSCQKEKKYK